MEVLNGMKLIQLDDADLCFDDDDISFKIRICRTCLKEILDFVDNNEAED